MSNSQELQKQLFINSSDFVQMVRLGVDNLTTHLDEVNELNVFPVPDGDTGTNMRRTIATGYDNIKEMENEPLNVVVQTLSKGMLLGARGNSGVILSQIFRGFSTGVGNKLRLDAPSLALAFKAAVDRAYSAVIKPVEGTILTVIRESVAKANTLLLGKTIYKYLCDLVDQARITLKNTKEMLPVLKEADVVDSGGAGLLYIFEGFKSYFEDGEIKNENSHILEEEGNKGAQELDFSLFNENSELDYGYCTEFILQLSAKKVNDCENFDVNEIIEYLTSVGESVVCFKDGTVVKTHVHTKDPGSILSYVRKWGEFLTVKVENMALQHNNKIHKEEESKKVKVHKPLASVAVSQGDGLTKAFKDLGVDQIVSGQQTMNPSTEDFINAFNNIDADTIIVFPNNSNIILAAEQARDLYMSEHENVRVEVIKSKSVCQGYVASQILEFPFDSVDELVESLNASIAQVSSIEVTTATRSTVISGVDVKEGHAIGILDHSLVADHESHLECLINSIKAIEELDEKENILIIFGKDGLKDKVNVLNRIKEEFKGFEIQTIDGEQDIYPFIVAVL